MTRGVSQKWFPTEESRRECFLRSQESSQQLLLLLSHKVRDRDGPLNSDMPTPNAQLKVGQIKLFMVHPENLVREWQGSETPPF